MARKLARLLKIDPNAIATDDDLEKRDQMIDVINLSAEQSLSSLSSRLDRLKEDMEEIGIKSLSLPSDVDVETLIDLIRNPEKFAGKDGEDGKDGQNGINGKDGDTINGSDGRDGRDGKDGDDGASGEKGEGGQIGNTGSNGQKGENGENGLDGSSIIDAYFDGNGNLVFQVNQGKPEINVGQLPNHNHTLSEISDYPFQQSTVYEQVKTALIAEVGTGWTLPNIDRAVKAAQADGLTDYDLILEYAKNRL